MDFFPFPVSPVWPFRLVGGGFGCLDPTCALFVLRVTSNQALCCLFDPVGYGDGSVRFVVTSEIVPELLLEV